MIARTFCQSRTFYEKQKQEMAEMKHQKEEILMYVNKTH